jgi:phosphoribosyl 1,2-cyclic phosphate phosphodiesterase
VLIERFGDGARPTRVVVDTGPEIRTQLAQARISAIDGVVYTHGHADHVHGIDDLRAYALTSGRMVDVYADDLTYLKLENAFGYCFRSLPGSFYPPILKRTRVTAGVPFGIDGPGGRIEINPIRQIHNDIETLGVRVGGIAYCCDVNDFPPESVSALEGVDTWILGALRYKPHPSHLTVAQAVEWVQRLKPRQAYLTHLHSDLDYRTLAGELPAGIEPAYDGLAVEEATP